MPMNQNVVANPRYLRRSFARFQELISKEKSPVVLLEGNHGCGGKSRKISAVMSSVRRDVSDDFDVERVWPFK